MKYENTNRLDTPFEDLNRRNFMSLAAKSCLGVSLMPLGLQSGLYGAPAASGTGGAAVTAKSIRGTAKNVIYLYMGGGMTHIDTFDLKQGTDVQGPIKGIKTKIKGYQVGQYLPKVAEQMDKVAVVNSLTSTQGAHEQGRYMMHTSYAPRGTIKHPGMGTWLLKLSGRRNATLPGNVLVGGSSSELHSGFMEAKYGPVPIRRPQDGLPNSKKYVDEKEFQARLRMADAFDRAFRRKYKQKAVRSYTDLYADAIKLMKSEDLEVFRIDQEPKNIRDMYGNSGFGQGVLLARRLIEKDVRFVEVGFGGWDTHNNNFDSISGRVPVLDQVLGALLKDLGDRGLLKTTLVVLATEFGRTPRINERQGRDHHPRVFSGLLAGGGIQGGTVYGKSDAKGHGIEKDGVKIPDFNATIASALGLPINKTLFSPSGRPFQVAHKGKPIAALF